MPDHIHLLASIPPKYSVSQFMGYLKGKSSLMISGRHAKVKYKFGDRHFWAEGYYVSTVGLNEATIRKYIQEQEAHDVAMDKVPRKNTRTLSRAAGSTKALLRLTFHISHRIMSIQIYRFDQLRQSSSILPGILPKLRTQAPNSRGQPCLLSRTLLPLAFFSQGFREPC